MKKSIILTLLAAMMAACEKLDMPSSEGDGNAETTKKITFNIKGDFSSPTFNEGGTRTTLSADGQEMTDLWVCDYVGDVCVQSFHQTPSDENWGKPEMRLKYGEHHVYFVASRGSEPVADADAHCITWSIPKDTFWKDYTVNVSKTSNGNRSVTLNRVATKLKLTLDDVIPTDCSTISFKPATWYYGLDYVSGTAMASSSRERSISVPVANRGANGFPSLTFFGISGTEEWTTDIDVNAYDESGTILASIAIEDAPFMSNRSTEYSGSMWGSMTSISVEVSADWAEPFVDEW